MEKAHQVATLRLQPGAVVPSSPSRLAAKVIKNTWHLEVRIEEGEAYFPFFFVKNPDFSYRTECSIFR